MGISGSNGQRSDVCSEPSPPSNPLTIPLGDIPLGGNVGTTSQGALSSRRSSTSSGSGSCSTAGSLQESLDSCWKRDFERRYIELEELGRGRFSVVRKCQEILTGQEVAVKFINRRKQTRDETQKEYEILATIGNERSCTVPSCLIRSSGLFLTATSDAIVMNLLNGSPFFVHLCEETSYTESSVANYMKQLLDGLDYLHSRNIVHLDLKPENLIVDTAKKSIHLIDFGAAQEIQMDKQHISYSSYVKSYSSGQDQCGTNLEFMAPEMLSNGPVGTYTDVWEFGVLLYVSLSGKSPFLDDSDEETKTNILRCDFSFPNEYFMNVSNQAKDLIQQCLCTDQNSRTSASCCLESTWLSEVMKHNPSEDLGVGNKRKNAISSMHLCDLVRRRMKKLNSVAPLLLAPSPSRIPRPESLYR